MRVCVFGSSSLNLDAVYVDAAFELGRTLAKHGHGIVFGGYDVGLMGAVAHGVAAESGSVIGVVTEGLNQKGRDIFPCEELICESDLATRKTRMIELADAFVTMPGGLGTFDEFFVVVSQVKAGELDAKSAILNVGGYFDPMVEMLDRACETGLNSTDWRRDCEVFNAPEPLVEWLEG